MSTFNAKSANRVQTLAVQYQSGAYQADSLSTSRTMIAQALTAGNN